MRLGTLLLIIIIVLLVLFLLRGRRGRLWITLPPGWAPLHAPVRSSPDLPND